MLTRVREKKQTRTRLETDKEMYFRRNGMFGIEVKRRREEENDIIGSLIESDIEIQKQIIQQNTEFEIRKKV